MLANKGGLLFLLHHLLPPYYDQQDSLCAIFTRSTIYLCFPPLSTSHVFNQPHLIFPVSCQSPALLDSSGGDT